MPKTIQIVEKEKSSLVDEVIEENQEPVSFLHIHQKGLYEAAEVPFIYLHKSNGNEFTMFNTFTDLSWAVNLNNPKDLNTVNHYMWIHKPNVKIIVTETYE